MVERLGRDGWDVKKKDEKMFEWVKIKERLR